MTRTVALTRHIAPLAHARPRQPPARPPRILPQRRNVSRKAMRRKARRVSPVSATDPTSPRRNGPAGGSPPDASTTTRRRKLLAAHGEATGRRVRRVARKNSSPSAAAPHAKKVRGKPDAPDAPDAGHAPHAFRRRRLATRRRVAAGSRSNRRPGPGVIHRVLACHSGNRLKPITYTSMTLKRHEQEAMHMINPEDEVIDDLRTSCTRDEAVIKMFGWMQGPIHKIDRATNDPLESNASTWSNSRALRFQKHCRNGEKPPGKH